MTNDKIRDADNKKLPEPTINHLYRKGDIRHCFSDISKISRLGFKPMMPLEKGLEELTKESAGVDAEDRLDTAIEIYSQKGILTSE